MYVSIYTIDIYKYVWYNDFGYIWKLSDAFPFYILWIKRGGGFMTKREQSLFIIILLLFFIVITLLFK